MSEGQPDPDRLLDRTKPVREGEELDLEALAAYLPAHLPEDLGLSAPLHVQVEQFPSGTDKWLAAQIFQISGLLAHDHHLGVGRPATEDHLRCPLVKRTRLAGTSQLANRPQPQLVRPP